MMGERDKISERERKYMCAVCRKLFMSTAKLDVHNLSCERKTVVQSSRSCETVLFQCRWCEESCEGLAEMQRHVRRHIIK